MELFWANFSKILFELEQILTFLNKVLTLNIIYSVYCIIYKVIYFCTTYIRIELIRVKSSRQNHNDREYKWDQAL